MGILIEHFAGAFPLWLAPEQVRVLPISDKVADYAATVLDSLKQAGLRAAIDSRPEKIGAKIRDAQLEKIPVMLVLGAKEAEAGNVSYRDRIDGDLGAMPLSEAITRLQAETSARTIRQKAESLPAAAATTEETAESHEY
jgi:threonyl-tRNA synthetase